MDRDFDGRLSFGEFMGEETPLEKVFKSMDKDGSGTITKEVSEHISFLDLVNQQKNDIKGHKAKNKQKTCGPSISFDIYRISRVLYQSD